MGEACGTQGEEVQTRLWLENLKKAGGLEDQGRDGDNIKMSLVILLGDFGFHVCNLV